MRTPAEVHAEWVETIEQAYIAGEPNTALVYAARHMLTRSREQDREIEGLRAEVDKATARAAAMHPVVEAVQRVSTSPPERIMRDLDALEREARSLDAVPVDERVGLMLAVIETGKQLADQLDSYGHAYDLDEPAKTFMVAVAALRGGA